MKNNQVGIGLIIIVVGALGFFGGMKYQESKAVSPRQFGGNLQNRIGSGNTFPGATQRNGSQQNGRQGFRPIMGEILDSNDTSITVKMATGGNKIIFVSSKTQINKAESASLSDLKKGETVSVFGQENNDGSVTAQNIQLNPIARGGNVSPTPSQTK